MSTKHLPSTARKPRLRSVPGIGTAKSIQQPTRPSPPTPARANQTRPVDYTGYLVVGLLVLAFMVGGLIGGIIGGGLMVWAVNPTPAAVAQAYPLPPTATPVVPTPVPTATAMPTATPVPVIQPANDLSSPPLPSPTTSPADVIARVLPSVVTVVNFKAESSQSEATTDLRIVGSGVIVDKHGYIATNAHVVDEAARLEVVFANGDILPATVLVQNQSQDLALLWVDQTQLQAIEWGDVHALRVGQPVIAIGSALGDFPNSVTMGIVSGLNRALALHNTVLYGLIQTDAAINQGNSGGPLLNQHGEVIGLNTFVIREDHTQGVAQGISFAIPASSVQIFTEVWIEQDLARRGLSEPPETPVFLLPAAQE